MLFHHDPLHSDDFLDSFPATASQRWERAGGDPERSSSRPSAARSSSPPAAKVEAARQPAAG